MKKTISSDNATTHKISKVRDKIKENKTALSLISNGLTWRIQSLDISISRVFKESLRSKYVGYWISKTI